MIRNLKQRHEDQIRKNAERIAERIGYVLSRLDSGDALSVQHYVYGIEEDAHEIRTRISALDAIREAVGVLEAGDA